MNTQAGFAQVLLVGIIAVIIAVVGFAGWRVYDANQPDSTNTAAVQTQPQQSIESAAQADEAVKELEQINLDQDLNPSELDQDLADLQ